jgi:hypothetical protein
MIAKSRNLILYVAPIENRENEVIFRNGDRFCSVDIPYDLEEKNVKYFVREVEMFLDQEINK